MKWRLYLEGLTDLAHRYAYTFRAAWRDRKSLAPGGFRAEEADFLPDALAIREKPPASLSRICSWLIIIAALTALLWCAIGKIDIIASARGIVIPVGNSKIIQSSTNGRVTAIHVKDGDQVVKGQTLIDIDDAIPRADRSSAKTQLSRSTQEYIAANILLEKLTSRVWEQGDLVYASPEDVRFSKELAEAEYREYTTHLAALQQTEVSRRSSANASKNLIAQYVAAMPLIEQKAVDYEHLFEEGYVSKHDTYDKRKQRIDLVGALNSERSRYAEAQAMAAGAKADVSNFEAEFLARQQSRKKDAWEKIESRLQDIAKAEAQIQNAHLKSPIDGIVQQLAVHSNAAVVNQGQSILTIVPKDAPVQIQAELENGDIGFVKSGQLAEIKIDAFPYTEYGTFRGKISTVSQDSIPDKNSQPKFQVYATLISDGKSRQSLISPGMAATVEIQTGRRRILDYMLSPLKEALSTSFHER